MKRIRLLVSVLAFAFALALVPASAIASEPTTYVEFVVGIETGVPQSTPTCPSVSSFAGIARGTLNGVFQIAVCHTPLDTSASILGGVFTISNGTTTVTGGFSNGTVVLVSTFVSGSLCIQRFAVNGGLLPAGQFGGRLVHYGVWTGSSCNVFFATISGSAQLTA